MYFLSGTTLPPFISTLGAMLERVGRIVKTRGRWRRCFPIAWPLLPQLVLVRPSGLGSVCVDRAVWFCWSDRPVSVSCVGRTVRSWSRLCWLDRTVWLVGPSGLVGRTVRSRSCLCWPDRPVCWPGRPVPVLFCWPGRPVPVLFCWPDRPSRSDQDPVFPPYIRSVDLLFGREGKT